MRNAIIVIFLRYKRKIFEIGFNGSSEYVVILYNHKHDEMCEQNRMKKLDS